MPATTQSILDTRRHQIFPMLEPAEIERCAGSERPAPMGPARRSPRSAKWASASRHPGRQGRHHRRHDGSQHADRHPEPAHPWASWRSWRAGRRGRRPCAGSGRGADHPAGQVPGVADRGSRARGADHARPYLAPGRVARDRSRRTGDRRPRRNGDVLRLEGFLRRNGHPNQTLDPEIDAEARALIDRFHVDAGQLPIVLCPTGQLLRNPTKARSPVASGWWGRSIPTRL